MIEPWEAYGVCGNCKALVAYGDERSHPCRTYFSTDYLSKINPTNEPWMPGYRFGLGQIARTGRSTMKMRLRTYHVSFRIDGNGILQHSGGVKPTPETMALAEELYAKNRPGSNYYPGWDKE